MIRTGAIILSFWTGINLLFGLGILFLLLILHKNAPALMILYGDTRANGIDPRALATINAFAVVFNACAAALCTLSLVVIWIPLMQKKVWAFWALSGSLLFLQGAGFASDAFFEHKDLLLNVLSSAVLLSGIIFVGIEMFRRGVTRGSIHRHEIKPGKFSR